MSVNIEKGINIHTYWRQFLGHWKPGSKTQELAQTRVISLTNKAIISREVTYTLILHSDSPMRIPF